MMRESFPAVDRQIRAKLKWFKLNCFRRLNNPEE
jgi:hypothetical protein